MTPLDSLCTAPFHELDDAARARVLNRLADTELFIALEAEPVDDRVRLRLFELPEGKLAIAADQEERLAGFFGAPTAHLAMPGRALASMLSDVGVTLMVNPGASSEMLLDANVLGWLSNALSQGPAEEEAAPATLSAPLPETVAALAEPLAARLSDMQGLTDGAALVAANWPDGQEGHLLILASVEEAQRPLLAKAIAELLAFLPPLPGRCDVAFDLPLPKGAVILQLERPEPEQTAPDVPRAPGSDPDKPPILRF